MESCRQILEKDDSECDDANWTNETLDAIEKRQLHLEGIEQLPVCISEQDQENEAVEQNAKERYTGVNGDPDIV